MSKTIIIHEGISEYEKLQAVAKYINDLNDNDIVITEANIDNKDINLLVELLGLTNTYAQALQEMSMVVSKSQV